MSPDTSACTVRVSMFGASYRLQALSEMVRASAVHQKNGYFSSGSICQCEVPC